jgi:Tfp pilus assembly protein FimV
LNHIPCVIHWLRPEYQVKTLGGTSSITNPTLNLIESKPAKKTKTKAAKPKGKTAWPKSLAERVQAVETALHQFGGPATPADLAQQFARAKPADIAEILEALVTLGRARQQAGKFTR